MEDFPNWNPWFPSSLHRMSLISPPPALRRLSCSTVEDLTLYPPTSWIQQRVNDKVSPNEWPQLRQIRASCELLAWTDLRLRHLRDITLYSGDGIFGHCATELCREIILHPTNFPSLEYICMDTCPQWDIFFILLERRNIYTTSGISRLRHIGLPSISPTRLHQPITELLGGRLPERPSNYDLSVIGNLDIIMDMTM